RRDITHCIHLAYLMSAEVEADMALGVKVNLLGMVNMFEAAMRNKLARLVFTSSETVYGASQTVYGDRPVIEDDYCSPADNFFTYGVMKILDEFMAQKYVAKHRVAIACARPAVVFGHGRKRGSVLWAEDFATQSDLGLDVITDGEAYRENMYYFYQKRVDGVTFENMPRIAFGDAGFGIECPRVIGRIENPRFHLAHNWRLAREAASAHVRVKQTVTGPH